MSDPADPTAGRTFRTTLLLARKTATGVEVPEEVVAALGGGRQPLVTVRIGDHAYRSRIAVRGGTSMLPVSAEHREAAGVEAGDEVEVTVALDTEPRTVVIPDDLAEALADEPEARRFFDGLSPSAQGRFVTSIEGAKTAETRRRRVDKAVERLREGRSDR